MSVYSRQEYIDIGNSSDLPEDMNSVILGSEKMSEMKSISVSDKLYLADSVVEMCKVFGKLLTSYKFFIR